MPASELATGVTLIVVPALCPGGFLNPRQFKMYEFFMVAESHANYDKLHPAVNQCLCMLSCNGLIAHPECFPTLC